MNLLKAIAAGLAVSVSISTVSNAQIDGDLLSGMSARAIGPAGMSGRISAIDAVASDPNHIVVGVATGGVWISDNGGLNWTPVFDDQPCASVGAVAINQQNPDIIWVGTGEGNTRNSTSIGCGVFRSLDGGETWQQMGLEGSERIHRITLDPTNPDIAYVAAMGTLWGPNEERGLYKTADGGASWDRILYVDENTGAMDVKMDPTNPKKLFAGMWQFRRWPYNFESGGPGSGLYVSHDAGENWTHLQEEDGLPEGNLGRIFFAIAPSNPDRVYALVEATKSALIRSDDGGWSWVKINTDHDITDRPFYYNKIAVDSQNPDRVYRIGSRVKVSIDGGKNFEFMPAIACCAPSNTIHIDNHAWWINPADPRHMIDGNDGGIAITHDKGETWRFVENLPLAQFYHVAVDNDLPYNVYGGLQDNGSWRGPSEVWENGGIRNLHWQEVAFGDGFDTLADPEDSTQGYAMSQGGNLVRWNLNDGEQRLIMPNPPSPDVELRFNWNAGLAQDPFDTATIYYGSQFLHKSTDRGLTWTIISGDLTTNNPDHQIYKESGGLSYDVTAAENFTTIVSVAPSPVEEGVIWVGTDDGRVHVTRDGGANWESIEGRIRGPNKGAWIPMIEPSPHDASVAFVVVDDHRRSDMTPYAFRVENYGQRWRSIVSDDVSGYALSIQQDPVDPDLLFLGTEFGLFVSLNGGEDWSKWTSGVPTASVMDMAIQARDSDLVLGTHGRSIYVIDDYSGLRNLSADGFSNRFSLLSASNAIRYTVGQTPGGRFTGDGEFRSPNVPYGAALTFMASGDDLKHPDADKERARSIAARAGSDEEEKKAPKVTVTVADASGATVRTLKAPVVQGVNRVVWGLESDGAPPMPPLSVDDKSDGVLPAGPDVPPGTYTVTLVFDGTTQSAEVEVVQDPRGSHSLADQRAQYAALREVEDLYASAGEGLHTIYRARRDVATLKGLMADANRDAKVAGATEAPHTALMEKADELKKKLDAVEKRYQVLPNRQGRAYNGDRVLNIIGKAEQYVGSSQGAPTEAAQAAMAFAASNVSSAQAELDALMAGDVAAFKASVAEAGLGLLN